MIFADSDVPQHMLRKFPSSRYQNDVHEPIRNKSVVTLEKSEGVLTSSVQDLIALVERAILDVLDDASHGRTQCLGVSAIADLANARIAGGDKSLWLVQGLLAKLHEDGLIERCSQPNGRKGWRRVIEARH